LIDFFEEPVDATGFRNLRNFVWLPVTESTNELGRTWIDYAENEEVEVQPIVICAREQTAGRGRRDRIWRSPPGGLYVTFVWKLPEPTALPHVPLAAAVWGAEACARALGVVARLKWPNDLLCEGRKLGGILTEAKTRGDETHAVVGFGINIHENDATRSEAGATAAERESKTGASVAKTFVELCRQFDEYLARPAMEGIVEEWRRRTVHRSGDSLRVCLEAGENLVEGTYEGVTEEGFLRLKTGSGERIVAAGEIRSW
jgi:BirA family biotin operon repressor/biotin-[acetyl-CoA-carboxylase] ligase